jgi:kynurenine formamidase
MKLIDVSVPLDENLASYPNNTRFSHEPIKRVARRDSAIGSTQMSARAGTCGDAPQHVFDDGVRGSGARHLVDRGIKLVGVDYLSAEGLRKPGAPAHHALLGAGVIVIEGLDLRDVDPGIYDLYCLPLRVVGSDGAPARVVLRSS